MERFTVEALRARLGVQTGKLALWTYFSKKALDAAIDEVSCSKQPTSVPDVISSCQLRDLHYWLNLGRFILGDTSMHNAARCFHPESISYIITEWSERCLMRRGNTKIRLYLSTSVLKFVIAETIVFFHQMKFLVTK
jgi:hypothetical protein